jgi:hypothetical protein
MFVIGASDVLLNVFALLNQLCVAQDVLAVMPNDYRTPVLLLNSTSQILLRRES